MQRRRCVLLPFQKALCSPAALPFCPRLCPSRRRAPSPPPPLSANRAAAIALEAPWNDAALSPSLPARNAKRADRAESCTARGPPHTITPRRRRPAANNGANRAAPDSCLPRPLRPQASVPLAPRTTRASTARQAAAALPPAAPMGAISRAGCHLPLPLGLQLHRRRHIPNPVDIKGRQQHAVRLPETLKRAQIPCFVLSYLPLHTRCMQSVQIFPLP